MTGWNQCGNRNSELWLKEGDINTKFFHSSTLIRRRPNHIPVSILNSRAISWDWNVIGKEFLNFYKDLFSSTNLVFNMQINEVFPPMISNSQNGFIASIPSPRRLRKPYGVCMH